MELTTRKRASLLGAMVGDAAALGLHWLYDPVHAEALSKQLPGRHAGGLEFLPPLASNFEGRPGYFAHEGKRVGDITHYGAHLLCAVQAIADAKGVWSRQRFLSSFATMFGPGGRWVGYIDGATGTTLRNVSAQSDSAIAAAVSAAGLSGKGEQYAARYIPKKHQTFSGADLQAEIDTVFASALKDEPNLAELRVQARQAAKLFEEGLTGSPGADDNQVSAFAKIPAVVVALLPQDGAQPVDRAAIEDAVRLTNNNDDAVAYSLYGAAVLEQVLLGADVHTALGSAIRTVAHMPDVKDKIQAALQPQVRDFTATQLAAEFGMPCPLECCIPLSVAILHREGIDYKSAIRLSIAACGDNAGRNVFIGAVLGAAHGIGTPKGVPLSWIGQLTEISNITTAIDEAVLL